MSDKKKKRATDEAMGDLHIALSKELKRQLEAKHYKTVRVEKTDEEEGGTVDVVVEEPPSPAFLNVCRQFLKDNKIESSSVPTSAEFLTPDDLPPFDEDETGNVVQFKAQ